MMTKSKVSIGQAPRLVVGRQVALAAGFIQQHGRGDRDVQAVGDAVHRQADGRGVGLGPGVGEAVGLRAKDDRDRSAQVRVRVGERGVHAGRHDVMPRSLSQATTSSVGAAASGTVKTVPALARMTFGLNRSVRGDAAITASAPAPSALRRTAPTLPGFSTRSRTTMRGSDGRCCSRSARAVDGIRATATSPSARSPKASLSGPPR